MAVTAPAQKPRQSTFRTLFPGVALATVIAAAAYGLNLIPAWPFTVHGKHPIESVMLAILLGLLINNLFKLPSSIAPGAKYCLHSVLALGIVLMGSRLNFLDVMKKGALSAGLVVVVIGVALVVSLWLGRLLKVESKLGALLAVGCTICGGSAIAATAPAIEAEDKDVAFAVGTITILGVIAMFLYPAIAGLIGLKDAGFGYWAGTAIHNTPQVVAAGMMHSPVSGEVATTVKMTRNLFIAPMVILFGYLFRRRRASEANIKLDYKKLFPLFVLGFVVMALIRTLLATNGLIGTEKDPAMLFGLFYWLNELSVWIITIAMAGIGLTTNLADMKKLGARGFVVGLLTTAVVAVVSLSLIFGLGLNTDR